MVVEFQSRPHRSLDAGAIGFKPAESPAKEMLLNAARGDLGNTRSGVDGSIGYCSRNPARLPFGHWVDIQGIREAHHDVEIRAVIDSFCDLRVGPTHVPQALCLFMGDAIRVLGKGANELEKEAVRWR